MPAILPAIAAGARALASQGAKLASKEAMKGVLKKGAKDAVVKKVRQKVGDGIKDKAKQKIKEKKSSVTKDRLLGKSSAYFKSDGRRHIRSDYFSSSTKIKTKESKISKSSNVLESILSEVKALRKSFSGLEKTFKDKNALDKKNAENARRLLNRQQKQEREDELESRKTTKEQKEEGGSEGPKMGLLDYITNFLKNILIGGLLAYLIQNKDKIGNSIKQVEKSKVALIKTLWRFRKPLIKLAKFGLKTLLNPLYLPAKILTGSIGLLGKGIKGVFNVLGRGLTFLFNKAIDLGRALIENAPRALNAARKGAGAVARGAGAVARGAGAAAKTTATATGKLIGKGIQKVKEEAPKVAQKIKETTTKAADKIRDKTPDKVKNFFGGIRDKVGSGIKATQEKALQIKKAIEASLKKIGGQLDSLSGGRLSKTVESAKQAYKNMPANARKLYDSAVSASVKVKNKVGKLYTGFKEGALNAAEFAKKGIGGLSSWVREKATRLIIDPLRPLVEPALEKVKNVGKSIKDKLSKVPGYDKVTKAAAEKGGVKALGGKVLPVVGGLFSLVSGYDRAANGDSVGALIESVSGVMDISTLFGNVAGSPISTLLDLYILGRDFVPQVQEKENEFISKMGLSPIKKIADDLFSKLPNIGEIINAFKGEDKAGQKPKTKPPSTSPSTSPSSSTPSSTPSSSNPSVSGPRGSFGPNTLALLDTIAFAEGTFNRPNSGYNTHFGFDETSDLSAHPAIIKGGGRLRSDAFGRYQFMSPTWGSLGGAVKPHDGKPFKTGRDMSPANQDWGAVQLVLRRLGMRSAEELEQRLSTEGLTAQLAAGLSGEWASFPNTAGQSAYGQPVKKFERLSTFYRGRIGKSSGQTDSDSGQSLEPSSTPPSIDSSSPPTRLESPATPPPIFGGATDILGLVSQYLTSGSSGSPSSGSPSSGSPSSNILSSLFPNTSSGLSSGSPSSSSPSSISPSSSSPSSGSPSSSSPSSGSPSSSSPSSGSPSSNILSSLFPNASSGSSSSGLSSPPQMSSASSSNVNFSTLNQQASYERQGMIPIVVPIGSGGQSMGGFGGRNGGVSFISGSSASDMASNYHRSRIVGSLYVK